MAMFAFFWGGGILEGTGGCTLTFWYDLTGSRLKGGGRNGTNRT